MEYLLLEHIESGHGSSEKNHTFDTIDEAYKYIKESRNLLMFFKLYEVKQIMLDEKQV